MSVKELKSKILEITKHMNLGQRESEDYAYKLFIEHAYESLVTSWFIVHGKYIGNPVYINGTPTYPNADFKATSVDEKTALIIAEAVEYYLHMVKDSEPYIDFLSLIHEEILLNGRRGENLGQFMTPPDIAMLLTDLIWSKKDIHSISEEKTLHEPCCGTGSMILASLAAIAKADSNKLEFMKLIINDLDAFMCKVTTVQIMASTLMHGFKLNTLLVYNCNYITEWGKENTLMLGIDWKPMPVCTKAFDSIMDKIGIGEKVTT